MRVMTSIEAYLPEFIHPNFQSFVRKQAAMLDAMASEVNSCLSYITDLNLFASTNMDEVSTVLTKYENESKITQALISFGRFK